VCQLSHVIAPMHPSRLYIEFSSLPLRDRVI
jgi:hypothetical protein